MESRMAQRRLRITRCSIILGMLLFWTLLGTGLIRRVEAGPKPGH